MKPVVAISSSGAMGAAVGARLVSNGVRVLTSFEGRSAASVERARQAGVEGADDVAIAQANVILSILPPGEAVGFARRMAAVLPTVSSPAVFVDCNAVSPATVTRIEQIIVPTGALFVDAGIIGGPPVAGKEGPTFAISGEHAARVATLREYGLTVTVLDAPVGAASSLKMCYGGLTKGLTALASSVILAAERAGVTESLRHELRSSQPALYAWLEKGVPGMYAKSYRWVAEMDEIAAFIGDRPESRIFEGASGLYQRIAHDFTGERKEIESLAKFLAKDEDKSNGG